MFKQSRVKTQNNKTKSQHKNKKLKKHVAKRHLATSLVESNNTNTLARNRKPLVKRQHASSLLFSNPESAANRARHVLPSGLKHLSTTTAVTSDNDTATTVQKTLLQRLKLSSAQDITLTAEEHKTFNRWKIVPPALLTHVSLGSIFAWSVFNAPLLVNNGVVEAAVSDWNLTSVMPVFSTTMATFGTVSFLSGRAGINEKFGPRVTSLLGAGLFAGGFGLSALATTTSSLPLLYLGYGLMCGSAVGTAYVGPVGALMRWFPDKKGLAAALAVAGFGSGGIFAAQFIEKFLSIFRKLPKRVGDANQYPTQVVDGKLMAVIDGVQQEVVIATTSSIKKLGKWGEHLQEGMYLVGSGDVGITNTFLALGVIYSLAMGVASLGFKLPNSRYDPTQPDNVQPLTTDAAANTAKLHKKKIAAGVTDATEAENKDNTIVHKKKNNEVADNETTKDQVAVDNNNNNNNATVVKKQKQIVEDNNETTIVNTTNDSTVMDNKKTPAEQQAALVEASKQATAVVKKFFDYQATEKDGSLRPANVLKVRQFWLVWVALACQSGAAYSIIGSAKTLMTDIYSLSYPAIVTSSFAAVFVSMISAFNLSGRIGWGSLSDKIGRKRTFDILFAMGIPFYLGIPLSAHLLDTGVDVQSSVLPLVLFYASVCLAISGFGGGAAMSPAYISDLFGPKYAAANAGQLLSYLMVSGYLGPVTCSQLRDLANKQAIEDLATKVDSATFFEKFGALPTQLPELIQNKTVTIGKMLEVCPVGTTDPTPYLYDNVFITMAALQFIGLLCNQGVKKVDPAIFEKQRQEDAAADAAAEAAKINAEAILNAPLDPAAKMKGMYVIQDLDKDGNKIDVKITPEEQQKIDEFNNIMHKDIISEKAQPLNINTESLKQDLEAAAGRAEEAKIEAAAAEKK